MNDNVNEWSVSKKLYKMHILGGSSRFVPFKASRKKEKMSLKDCSAFYDQYQCTSQGTMCLRVIKYSGHIECDSMVDCNLLLKIQPYDDS